MAVIPAPSDWVESVSRLKLPPRADRRLQELMDRNNEGRLSEAERADLEALVEIGSGRGIPPVRPQTCMTRSVL